MVWKIGIIGYGFSAKVFHIPFIQTLPEFELAAIVQRNPTPDNDAAKDFPGAQIFHDVESVLRTDAIDIVVITTPLDSHFSLTESALNSKKHVICEKPFTPTSAEASYLVNLAKEQDRVLAIYHNRRWDADFATVGSLIQSESFGRLTKFQSHFELDRPSQLTHIGTSEKISPFALGVIQNIGTHLIDQAICLFGLPDHINACFDSDIRECTKEEGAIFTVFLHYKNGLLVTVNAGRTDPSEQRPRFYVAGDTGNFTKLSQDVQKDHLALGMSPAQDGFAKEPIELYGALRSLTDETWIETLVPTVEPPTWAGYYRQFACAVDGCGKAPVSGAEARDVIRIIELAVQSFLVERKLDMEDIE